MLRTALCLGLICLWGAIANADEPERKPSFTGTWILDLTKSDLEIRSPESSTFVISHSEPSWKLDRTHIYRGKPNNLVMELRTDGSPKTVEIGHAQTESTLVWEGDSLILRWQESRNSLPTRNGEVRYSLRDGAETLVAEERMTGKRVSYHNIWVFARQ